MALKPIMLANCKAKKEQRLAVTVPAGPTETAEVSKLLPAEPMRTKMATSCGMNAYLAFLSSRTLSVQSSYGGAPFNCIDNGDTKSGNQANAKGGDDAANSDTQASAIDGRNHLAGNNGSDDSPAYLHDNVEDTGKL